MINLLKETLDAIKGCKHSLSDIVFIGSQDSGHQCTWEEFELLADVVYDNGYGAQKVATDLVIIFNDGGKLYRHEYDGSEWWRYDSPFRRPEVQLPIRSLFPPGDRIGWCDLASCNESRSDG